uniref:Uncharacterized protein n=1 Tax=Opuntia streptacantha TaxID=393608 RepID=A0A7C9CLB9_OPUST
MTSLTRLQRPRPTKLQPPCRARCCHKGSHGWMTEPHQLVGLSSIYLMFMKAIKLINASSPLYLLCLCFESQIPVSNQVIMSASLSRYHHLRPSVCLPDHM